MMLSDGEIYVCFLQVISALSLPKGEDVLTGPPLISIVRPGDGTPYS